MTIRYNTAAPVQMCPAPVIDRDIWSVRNIHIMPEKGHVSTVIVSALLDGGVPKDRRNVTMSLTWADVQSFPVGSAVTFGELLADLIESKAKARGILPTEATQA